MTAACLRTLMPSALWHPREASQSAPTSHHVPLKARQRDATGAAVPACLPSEGIRYLGWMMTPLTVMGDFWVSSMLSGLPMVLLVLWLQLTS
ncbi:hypothetical protein GUH95_00405 [Xanthomonas citri pv. citri]|nr:hypothetical protein [Xanthomonas citri pv. citri]